LGSANMQTKIEFHSKLFGKKLWEKDVWKMKKWTPIFRVFFDDFCTATPLGVHTGGVRRRPTSPKAESRARSLNQI
jgi:hypothetical protein